jgi:hypothetical protein
MESNPLCERKIFTERLAELVRPWAKMTIYSCQQASDLFDQLCTNWL